LERCTTARARKPSIICGQHIVLTPLLAAQLDWKHEREALVASSPGEFAEQCVRLHRDSNLWSDLQQSALERVALEFNPETFDRVIATIVRDAAKPPHLAATAEQAEA
jgi:hypothetical protein